MQKHLVILLCFFSAIVGIAQEQGFLPVLNYAPKQYKALQQNFCAVSDNQGILFFANSAGVLEFDGVYWRLIETTNQSMVKSLASDSLGNIFVGAVNEIGYLAVDSIGKRTYKTLNHLVNDSIEVGDVWAVFTTPEGVYFQSDFYLLHFQHDSISIYEMPNKIKSSFYVNNFLYLCLENQGLNKWVLNRLIPIPFGKQFSDEKVTGMVPISKTEVLLSAENSGLYLMKVNFYKEELSIAKKETKADIILNEYGVGKMILLNQGLVAIATFGSGLLIIDIDGNITNNITVKSGLRDQVINHLFEDSNQNLWLSLNNGIALVEATFPISVFDKKKNLFGTVEDICRFNGQLYCATHEGVFKLNTQTKNEKTNENPITEATFKKLNNLQCFDLLVFKYGSKKVLLGAFDDGVYEILPNGSTKLIYSCYPWELIQPKSDTSLVIIGLDPGLGFIKWTGQKWVIGKEATNFDAIFNFSENDSILWAGSFQGGKVYGLKNIYAKSNLTLNYTEITPKNNLPDGPVYTESWKNYTVFGTSKSIYIYEPNQNNFLPLQHNNQDTLQYIHRILNFNNEQLWAVTINSKEKLEIGYFQQLQSKLVWQTNALKTINEGIVHALLADSNGVVWMGGTEGLIRYDPTIKKNYTKPFTTFIREVVVNRAKTIFGGNYLNSKNMVVGMQPSTQIPQLNFDENTISFYFSAFIEGEGDNHFYTYQLIGLDTGWLPKSNEPKAIYTNLEPGDYIFQVKSTNLYGEESNISEFKFCISPPWYQTPWYYFGQFGFLGILVFFTIYLNRSKRNSEWTATITFIALITIFEFLVFLIEPYISVYTNNIPVFQLLMNIILAASLNPVEYWVRGILRNKNI